MQTRRREAPMVLVVALVAGLCGCAAKPPPTPPPAMVKGAIEASATVNPDARGRPSPIVVKVYELKAVGRFDAADFFSLFDKEREALDGELLGKEELTLRPGDRVPLERALDAETRYLGVVAGFRGLERARWRSSVALLPQRVNSVLIRLDAEGVTIRKE